jgi:hypothetical protein
MSYVQPICPFQSVQELTMGTQLCLHRGAVIVDRAELEGVAAPAATATWFPVRHADALAAVLDTLGEASFRVDREKLSLTPNKARFFGVLDLRNELLPGVTLAVGIRNSIDQTFPLGFCAGSRVFVCDNLSFASDLIVRRKHTRHGSLRFREDIAKAVHALGDFQDAETARIIDMQQNELGVWEAEHLIVSAYERGIISPRVLPGVLKAWRNPPADFAAPTYWSLFNAFTSALKERSQTQPQDFAVRTMRLYGLLKPSEN